jgi:glucose-6-phosphate isomerase
VRNLQLRQLFAGDPRRDARPGGETVCLYLDCSKSRVTGETITLPVWWADACSFAQHIDAIISSAIMSLDHDWIAR